jgi:hypothetical protein
MFLRIYNVCTLVSLCNIILTLRSELLEEKFSMKLRPIVGIWVRMSHARESSRNMNVGMEGVRKHHITWMVLWGLKNPSILFFFLDHIVQRRRLNTHAYSPLWIRVRKPYPFEHLRRIEYRLIWRFSKSPLAPRRRRERRLPLNA